MLDNHKLPCANQTLAPSFKERNVIFLHCTKIIAFEVDPRGRREIFFSGKLQFYEFYLRLSSICWPRYRNEQGARACIKIQLKKRLRILPASKNPLWPRWPRWPPVLTLPTFDSWLTFCHNENAAARAPQHPLYRKPWWAGTGRGRCPRPPATPPYPRSPTTPPCPWPTPSRTSTSSSLEGEICLCHWENQDDWREKKNETGPPEVKYSRITRLQSWDALSNRKKRKMLTSIPICWPCRLQPQKCDGAASMTSAKPEVRQLTPTPTSGTLPVSSDTWNRGQRGARRAGHRLSLAARHCPARFLREGIPSASRSLENYSSENSPLSAFLCVCSNKILHEAL